MKAPVRSTIFCDVDALAEPDVGSVCALARLQLEARRVGLELRLRRASRELQELIAFVGLEDVLRVEAGRQAEEREERVRIEEERQLGDPPV